MPGDETVDEGPFLTPEIRMLLEGGLKTHWTDDLLVTGIEVAAGLGYRIIDVDVGGSDSRKAILAAIARVITRGRARPPACP
jgi:hypothetical protein